MIIFPTGQISSIQRHPTPNERKPLGLAPLVKVPADMVRKTKPVADNPRNLRRFTVYPGTDSAKIADGLLLVTGVRWVAVEDEIKY